MPNEKPIRTQATTDTAVTQDAARTLESVRTGIILTGKVVNGRVELDQSSHDYVARNFASADVAFVALNAPFDPQAQPA